MNNTKRAIHPHLIRAYREAKYVIEHEGLLIMRIGEANSQLKKILGLHQVTTAAFITAFNPYSETRTDEENAIAQNALLVDIEKLGLSIINGYGQDVEGAWPREQSFLALGITESQAEVLADKYGQNAFVWIGSIDAFPALRLRHPIGLPTSADFADWLRGLPDNLLANAQKLGALDRAWLMSVSELEQAHWLNPESWDLNVPWPLGKPDGSAMGVGTEIDRVFKLISAGQSPIA